MINVPLLALPPPRGAVLPVGWCLDLGSRPDLWPVLVRAWSVLGLVEQPGNRGPEIDRWLKEAGVGVGSPWCAAVATSRDVWGELLPAGFPLASSYKLRAWGEKNGRLVKSGRVLPGDLFCILRPDGTGHVGIIAADLGDGRASTLEGNSGNAMRARIRSGAEFAAVVRPVPPSPLIAQASPVPDTQT